MDDSKNTDIGFKTGIDAKIAQFEVGADSQLWPRQAGPVTAQVKLAIPFGQGLPTFAVGAANITFDFQNRKRAGDVFAYSVLSEDLGFFRVHGGCADQGNVALPFFGIDKTFRIPKRHAAHDGKTAARGDGKECTDEKTTVEMRDLFTLRADAIQQQNHSWLSSVGVLVPVRKYFVLETWGNFRIDGTAASATVKGDFVFKF